MRRDRSGLVKNTHLSRTNHLSVWVRNARRLFGHRSDKEVEVWVMKGTYMIGSRLSIVAAAMVLAFALAACGSSSASTPVATTSAAGSATTPTTASTTAPTAATTSVATVAESTPMASPAADEGTPVAGSTTILVRDDPKYGKILTDSRGFTLYFYNKDSDGKSVCNGQCAVNWPPLKANGTPTAPDGVTGTLSVVTRDDGSQMVAYNGKPLYTYIKDTDPEDTYGQGVGSVWFIAQP